MSASRLIVAYLKTKQRRINIQIEVIIISDI